MGILLRILVMLFGLLFLIKVILEIKKTKLSEWQAMLWIVASIILIILGAFPGIVTWAAGLLGIYWAPSLVFLVAIVIIAIICFNHAKEISVMRSEISEQAMHISLLKKQMKQMEEKLDELSGVNEDEHSGLR